MKTFAIEALEVDDPENTWDFTITAEDEAEARKVIENSHRYEILVISEVN